MCIATLLLTLNVLGLMVQQVKFCECAANENSCARPMVRHAQGQCEFMSSCSWVNSPSFTHFCRAAFVSYPTACKTRKSSSSVLPALARVSPPAWAVPRYLSTAETHTASSRHGLFMGYPKRRASVVRLTFAVLELGRLPDCIADQCKFSGICGPSNGIII